MLETNQFAEFASAVVRQLPRDLSPRAAQKWIQDQKRLAEVLRAGLVPQPNFELYLHDNQNGGVIKGFELEKHLIETGHIKRALSLDSPEVKNWIRDPATYPDEFKGETVFLWGSIRGSGGSRRVACLVWSDDRVEVLWGWLDNDWGRHSPALLASSFDL